MTETLENKEIKIFDIKQIESIIPHRLPMRLINKVIEKDGILQGYPRDLNPNDPIMRPCHSFQLVVLAVEALAQTAAISEMAKYKNAAVLFKSIKDLSFNPWWTPWKDGEFLVMPISDSSGDRSAIIELNHTDITERSLQGEISCVIEENRDRFDKLMNMLRKRSLRKPVELKSKLDFFEQIRSIDPVEQEGKTLQVLYLGENDPIIQGHFPEMPIMPGVFQLLAALVIIQDRYRGISEIAMVKKFSFEKPIFPPSVIKVVTEATNDGQKVEIYGNDTLSATGLITLKPR